VYDGRSERVCGGGVVFGLCVCYPSFAVWDLRSGTELMRTADVPVQTVELKLPLEVPILAVQN
jgi:hypothetical protein